MWPRHFCRGAAVSVPPVVRARPPPPPRAARVPAGPLVPTPPLTPAVAGSVNLTIPLQTLLGMSSQPGEVAGLGPLTPAATSGILAAARAGGAAVRWCVTVTDHHGRPAGHGCAAGQPQQPNPGRWGFSLTVFAGEDQGPGDRARCPEPECPRRWPQRPAPAVLSSQAQPGRGTVGSVRRPTSPIGRDGTQTSSPSRCRTVLMASCPGLLAKTSVSSLRSTWASTSWPGDMNPRAAER